MNSIVSFLIFWIILNCFSLVAHADSNFERVFTTPKQRLFLDQLRMAQPEPESKQANTSDTGAMMLMQDKADTTRIPTQAVKLSGVIIRHDGKSAVWHDKGLSYSEDESNDVLETVAIKSEPGSIYVKTNDKVKTFKAGQIWVLHNNEVFENYEAQDVTELLTPELAEPEKESTKENIDTAGKKDKETTPNTLQKIKDYNQQVEALDAMFKNELSKPL